MKEIIKKIKVYRFEELEGLGRCDAFNFLKEGYEDWAGDEFVGNMETAVNKLGLEVEEYDLERVS